VTDAIFYEEDVRAFGDGRGGNSDLFDRNGVRTHMQWNVEPDAGFSQADPDPYFLPLIAGWDYAPAWVNVADDRAAQPGTGLAGGERQPSSYDINNRRRAAAGIGTVPVCVAPPISKSSPKKVHEAARRYPRSKGLLSGGRHPGPARPLLSKSFFGLKVSPSFPGSWDNSPPPSAWAGLGRSYRGPPLNPRQIRGSAPASRARARRQSPDREPAG
jgi:hypothetical protein